MKFEAYMRGSLHNVGSDPNISLKDMRTLLNKWISQYGAEAILTTDAGYNNVDLHIDNRRSSINQYVKEI
jgi:hypothetical protein